MICRGRGETETNNGLCWCRECRCKRNEDGKEQRGENVESLHFFVL